MRRSTKISWWLMTVLAFTAAPVNAQAPSGHLTLENPGTLSDAEANSAYREIRDQLAERYAISRDPSATKFLSWTRLNRVPYMSATHGNRYVNNFGDPAAVGAGYGAMKRGDKMPPGAVIAKDSFTVTDLGEIYGAALFLMEKLAPGANSKTADWRYAMILPDGSFTGDSMGVSAEDVEYCHACHRAKAATDYLFQVPKSFRK